MTYRSKEAADRILRKNLSARFLRLDALERVVEGTQYEGRPDFWDPDIPLFHKEPVVKSRIVADAISDNKALLLGEGRYPDITSRPGEDNRRQGEAAELDDGVSASESEVFDDLIDAVTAQTSLRAHERAKYGSAQGCGTAVGLYGFRNGKLFADQIRAKWCAAEWRDHDTAEGKADGELERVTVQYPYLLEVKEGGRCQYQVLLYRRVIDRQRDVTYKPVEAPEDGRDPDPGVWLEEPSKTLSHGFGFVPVVWWRFERLDGQADGTGCIDGKAIHEGVDVEPLDMALSQRHRSALYLQPQIYEIGVNPGYNPTEPADDPMGYGGPEEGPKARIRIANPGESGGRKVGPGWTLQYPHADTKVGMLESNGESLRAIAEHANDLEAKLAQSLAVVFLDPSRIKFAGAMSGRALKMMKLRQIDRIAEHHDDWVKHSSQPTLSMLCRIALLKRNELRLPALKPALPILARFAHGGTWTFPDLAHIRGPWFELDPEEEQQLIATTKLAREANLCTEIQAVRKAQPVMGGTDPADTLAAIRDEREAARKQALQDMQTRSRVEAAAYHGHLNESDANGDSPPVDAA